MFKALLFFAFIFPGSVFAASITKTDIIGNWESLGGSITQSRNLSGLTSPGPNINRFHANGKYEYIVIQKDSQAKPVNGTWVLKNGVLSITRPDSGTFNNIITHYKNGVLETKEDDTGIYQYWKKK